MKSFKPCPVRSTRRATKPSHSKGLDQVPMVLVGNKVDLEGSRAVSQEEARELAISFGCAWMETSAKSRVRVEDSFFALVRPEGRAACRSETQHATL